VLQDEVSKADSKSGLPMFGTEFSYWGHAGRRGNGLVLERIRARHHIV